MASSSSSRRSIRICEVKELRDIPGGAGSYGTVKIFVAEDGTEYALKSYENREPGPKKKKKNPGEISFIESDILFRMNSPNLLRGVTIYDGVECGEKTLLPTDPGILLQLCQETLEHKKLVPGFELVFHDLALGLKCLHENNYLHLDIKAANALLYEGTDSSGEERLIGCLADFGISEPVDSVDRMVVTKNVGTTPIYRPPESHLQANHYNGKSDIWSLGMLYLEVVTDKYYDIIEDNNSAGIVKAQREMFEGPNITSTLEELLTPQKKMLGSSYPLLFDLLSKMLAFQHEERPSIQNVLAHPFFQEVRTKQSGFCTAVQPSGSVVPNFGNPEMSALQGIVSTVRERWGFAKVSLLFLILELSVRTLASGLIFRDGSRADPTEICFVAASVAFEYYYPYTSELQLTSENKKPVDPLKQVALLKALGGVIRRKGFYETAKNLGQLSQVYNYIFSNPEMCARSMTLDPSEIYTQLEKSEPLRYRKEFFDIDVRAFFRYNYKTGTFE